MCSFNPRFNQILQLTKITKKNSTYKKIIFYNYLYWLGNNNKQSYKKVLI